MSKVINLRRVRKAKARSDKARVAQANATHHGQSKAQRLQLSAEQAMAKAHLDGHKRDDS